MFCKNCGKQIPDGSVWCSFCGTSQKNNTSLEQPLEQPMFVPVAPPTPPSPPVPPKKDHSNKSLFIVIIAALLVIIAVIVGVFVIKPMIEEKDDPTQKSTNETETLEVIEPFTPGTTREENTSAPEVETETKEEATTQKPTTTKPVTTKPTTTKPATTKPTTTKPVDNTVYAEKAVDTYLSTLSAEKLMEQSGEDLSQLGDDGDLGMKIFQAIIKGSKYQIVSSKVIDSKTVKVTVALYVPNADTIVDKLYTDLESYVTKYPNATEQDLIDEAVRSVNKTCTASNTPRDKKTVTLTVKLTNGSWKVQYSQDLALAFLDDISTELK